MAEKCNKQNFNAKKAGEMSTNLYMLKYIELNSPIETEAVVVEVKGRSLDVIFVSMNLNQRIYFDPVRLLFVFSYTNICPWLLRRFSGYEKLGEKLGYAAAG